MKADTLIMPTTKRLLARRIVNASVSTGGNLLFPGLGSLLEAIYSVTHKDISEKELTDWRQQTDVNLQKLIDEVFPSILLSETAALIALDLCNSSTKGRAKFDYFTIESIHAEFPKLTKEQIEDGVAELLHFGLISKGPTAQTLVTPEYSLFWLFDPLSNLQTDPYQDAKALAREALQAPTFNSRKIIKKLGWSPRRFNPALSYMLNEISEAFIISRESNPDLIVVGMHYKTETRFQIGLFLGEAL
ncbi:hypothetical protein ACFOOP_06775 [Marinicaulis aureus]|uniref:DUF4393 domain-containing protein n=1 Tax=Hyphococcus aureus TaxID=2666033 RepID=A0ABW1KVR8_9PROT